jgi:hypothetical protein
LVFFYFTVFGAFLCLMPLSLYCLAMAGINRRPNPTLVSGLADFAWAVMAVSGFLIVGGPAALASIHDTWRRGVHRGSFDAVGASVLGADWPWLLLWAAYFAAVVIGVVLAFRRRRAWSVIYNIDSGSADSALADACRRLGIAIERRGGQIVLDKAGRPAELELRAAPILRSVTLDWRSDPLAIRSFVEDELQRRLGTTAVPVNPIASWLTAVATALFIVQVVAFAMLVLFLYYARQ